MLVLAVLMTAAPVRAADGILEINQACANVGCFAGDAARFPVTISAPGSYALTSDLTVTSANATVIQVTAAGVQLDLRGFAIRGPNVCDGIPLACSNSGSGIGVDTTTAATDLVVRNGRVQGMGGSGISVQASSRVESVRAISNGSDGIEAAGRGFVVYRCRAERNGSDGISGGSGSVFEGNKVAFNGRFGLLAGIRSLIQFNAVTRNGNTGVQVDADALIRENVITANNLALDPFGAGLILGNDSRVVGNTLTENRLRNIRVTSGDNLFDSNHITDGDFGIDFDTSAPNGYRDNTTAGNITDYGGSGITFQVDLGGNVSF